MISSRTMGSSSSPEIMVGRTSPLIVSSHLSVLGFGATPRAAVRQSLRPGGAGGALGSRDPPHREQQADPVVSFPHVAPGCATSVRTTTQLRASRAVYN